MGAIPHVIHYCWFGRKPLSNKEISCIESWKKHLPGFEIIQWNEDNYDVNKNTFISEAYRSGKWAFVSDYARLDILYENGGIYFDTDVELLKNIDDIIAQGPFMGIESGNLDDSCREFTVNPGLGIGTTAEHPIYKELLDDYSSRHFLDEKGKQIYKTIVDITTDVLMKHDIIVDNGIGRCCGISLYPQEYFCPQNFFTGELKITDNTRSIHRYDGSWMTPLLKKIISIKVNCIKKYGIKTGKIIGKIVASPWIIAYKLNNK